MGTIDTYVLRVECIIAFAAAMCGGLAVCIMARLLVPGAYATLACGAAFAVLSGCIELVKLGIRRRPAVEAMALAATDAAGVFAGYGLAMSIFFIAP